MTCSAIACVYQNPIKRISMEPRQLQHSPGVVRLQWQQDYLLRREALVEVTRHFQLTDAALQPDLPKADGTDENGVRWIGYEGRSLRRKTEIIRQPPKQEVGIEQEPQSRSLDIPEAAAMSSGSASESDDIRISPAIEPGLRGCAVQVRDRLARLA
jgi:hypothetical protein